MGSSSSIPPSPKRDSVVPETNQETSLSRRRYRGKRMIIPKFRRKLMGNLILPVTYKETDEKIPFGDQKYYKNLEKNGERQDVKLWNEVKTFLEIATGKTIEDLSEMSFDNAKTQDLDDVAMKIEHAVIKYSNFLKGSNHDEKKSQLKDLSKKANRLYRHLIKHIPRAQQSLRFGTTLTNADNNVGQLALKYIASTNPRLRHHSKIKMLLMLHCGLATKNVEKVDGFDESLGFLTNFISREVQYDGKDDEKGCSKTKYLVTKHTRKIKKTESFEIIDSLDGLELSDYMKVQKIEVRKANVKNKEGIERVIEFTIDAREKDEESHAEKILRDGNTSVKDHHGVKFIFHNKEDAIDFERTLIEKLQKKYSRVLMDEYSKIRDRERTAGVVIEEWNKELEEIMKRKQEDKATKGDEERAMVIVEKRRTAEESQKECLKNEERIKEMVKKEDECIFIEWIKKEKMLDNDGKELLDKKGETMTKRKAIKSNDALSIIEQITDNIEGGERTSGSRGGSSSFKVRKYYLDYIYPDYLKKRLMPFEWQFQLYDGFVDTLVRDDVCEEIFHKNRVFDGGIMDLIAPVEVYPEIDLKAAQKEGVEEIRNRIEDQMTHSRKGLKKLRQQRRMKDGNSKDSNNNRNGKKKKKKKKK